MTEYAFDVKLWAVCRIDADNEKEARAKMLDHISCINIGYEREGVLITEATLEDDGDSSELIEINGDAT